MADFTTPRIGPHPDNMQAAMRYLQSRGFAPADAAALVWNFSQESGRNLNTTLSHDNGTGFGIAGYRDPTPGHGRWSNLLAFARQSGRDPNDLYTQLDFAQHELQTSERAAWDRIQAAQTPEAKAIAAISYFRPAAAYAANRARHAGEVTALLNGQPDAGGSTLAQQFTTAPAGPAGPATPATPVTPAPPLPTSATVASAPVAGTPNSATLAQAFALSGLNDQMGSALAGLFAPSQPQQTPSRDVAAALLGSDDINSAAAQARQQAVAASNERRRRLAYGGAPPTLANAYG